MAQRSPRLLDPGYLAWLRTKRCCVCRRPPPSEATHIRHSDASESKVNPGIGCKPHDRHALPLCSLCHREGPKSQHNVGDESAFWHMNMIDPIKFAAAYYAEYGGDGGKPRKPRAIKPRLPREKRAKIFNRGFSK